MPGALQAGHQAGPQMPSQQWAFHGRNVKILCRSLHMALMDSFRQLPP